MKIAQADRSQFWDLPKGTKFNQDYFIDTVLPNLYSEKRRIARRKGLLSFAVHMDNSMCQNGAKIIEKFEKRHIAHLRFFKPFFSTFSILIWYDINFQSPIVTLFNISIFTPINQSHHEKINFLSDY
jgi:hypothetical protein